MDQDKEQCCSFHLYLQQQTVTSYVVIYDREQLFPVNWVRLHMMQKSY